MNGETYREISSDERLLEVIGKEGDDHDGKDELEDAQDEIGEVGLARGVAVTNAGHVDFDLLRLS